MKTPVFLRGPAIMFALGMSLALAGTSCGKKEEEPSKLLVNLAVKKTILIPGTTLSCHGAATRATSDDIASLYMNFGRPEFTWQSNNTSFRLIYVKIKLESGFFDGGVASCIIDADEMESVFKDTKFNDLEFDPDDRVEGEDFPTAKATCPLKCGGIAVSDPSVSFTANGEITVVGVDVSGEDEIPITTRVPIEIEHISVE